MHAARLRSELPLSVLFLVFFLKIVSIVFFFGTDLPFLRRSYVLLANTLFVLSKRDGTIFLKRKGVTALSFFFRLGLVWMRFETERKLRRNS